MQHRQSETVRFIIKALADDYESAETLANYFTNQEKQPFSRAEFDQALTELITGGYVQAFSYSDTKKKLVPAAFPSTAYDSLWFGLTSKGNDLLEK